MRPGRRPAALLVVVAAGAAAGVVALGADTDGADPARSTAVVRSTATEPRATPTIAPTATPDQRPLRRVYGRGANAVTVVRPAGADGPLPGVLFLHGWGYQRSRDYRRWIDHLARRGNVVIVPRYQSSQRSDPTRVRGAMLRGVRTAVRQISLQSRSLVVAGHSAGAALAADYAAVARSHGLPRPRAVYAVFPGRRILGTPGIPSADLTRIAASTRLLVLAGADDAVVGQAPARELRAAATSIPASRRRFVLVRDTRVADHLAPLRTAKVSRSTFWRRLDRLIEVARRPNTP